MTKVITKHGVHPNGIFIGDYLREGFCDESYKIYLYVTSISDPSLGQIMNYIKSIGFTHLKDNYYANDNKLKLDVYVHPADHRVTVSFYRHDANTASNLKKRYDFMKELSQYSKHLPLSTY